MLELADFACDLELGNDLLVECQQQALLLTHAFALIIAGSPHEAGIRQREGELEIRRRGIADDGEAVTAHGARGGCRCRWCGGRLGARDRCGGAGLWSAFGTWCARCRRGAWCAGRGGRCLGLAAQRGDVECGLVGHRAARRRPVGKLVGMRTSRRGNEASPEISIARIEALRQLVEGRGGIPGRCGLGHRGMFGRRGSGGPGFRLGLRPGDGGGQKQWVFAPQHSFAAQLEAEHHDRIVNRLAGADDDPAVLSRAGERNARLPDPGKIRAASRGEADAGAIRACACDQGDFDSQRLADCRLTDDAAKTNGMGPSARQEGQAGRCCSGKIAHRRCLYVVGAVCESIGCCRRGATFQTK